MLTRSARHSDHSCRVLLSTPPTWLRAATSRLTRRGEPAPCPRAAHAARRSRSSTLSSGRDSPRSSSPVSPLARCVIESKAAPLAAAAALAVGLTPQNSVRVLGCTLPAAPVLDRHGDQSHRVGSLAPDCCGLSRANGGGPRLHPADRAPNRPRRGLGADDLPQALVPGLAPGLCEARVVRSAVCGK